MAAGIFRVGGIATFVADADRYLLATFNHEVLKFVKVEHPVEAALGLCPGQIFTARVGSIRYANASVRELADLGNRQEYAFVPSEITAVRIVKRKPTRLFSSGPIARRALLCP
jgi:hypothetical protein